MGLNLYRRHRRDCKAGHPEDSKSSDLDERRKGWKRCECPIFVTGSLQGKFRRQSTGKWEWSDAKAVAESLETAGTFSGATASTRSMGLNPIAAHMASLTESSDAALRRTILGEPSVPELCKSNPA